MPNLDFTIYFYISLRQKYFFLMEKKVIGKMIDMVIYRKPAMLRCVMLYNTMLYNEYNIIYNDI